MRKKGYGSSLWFKLSILHRALHYLKGRQLEQQPTMVNVALLTVWWHLRKAIMLKQETEAYGRY